MPYNTLGDAVEENDEDVKYMKIKKEELTTSIEDADPSGEEDVPTAEEIREESERRLFGRIASNTEDTLRETRLALGDWNKGHCPKIRDDYTPVRGKRTTSKYSRSKRRKGLCDTDWKKEACDDDADDDFVDPIGAAEQLLNRHREMEGRRLKEREQQPVAKSDIKHLKTRKRQDIVIKDSNIILKHVVTSKDEPIWQDEENILSSVFPKTEMISQVVEPVAFVSCGKLEEHDETEEVREENSNSASMKIEMVSRTIEGLGYPKEVKLEANCK